MSSFLLLAVTVLIHTYSACTPCNKVDSGLFDLNANYHLPIIGDAYCVGHTQNKGEISGTFHVHFSINTTASDPDYAHPLSYQLAVYNDEAGSYDSLNSSQTCLQQLSEKRSKEIKDVIFEHNAFEAAIEIAEPVTRDWYLLLTHCDEEDLVDPNIVYPLINYRINLTLSSYVLEREKTCENEAEPISAGAVVGIICAVIVMLVIGGVSMWLCDAYKRKKIREKALKQALVMDEEEVEEEEDDDENGDKNEQGQAFQEDEYPLNNNDQVELETA